MYYVAVVLYISQFISQATQSVFIMGDKPCERKNAMHCAELKVWLAVMDLLKSIMDWKVFNFLSNQIRLKWMGLG